MNLTIEDLRRSAAELLAAATVELLPQVVLIGGDITKSGFFYDFIIKQPLSDQLLSMIEERMWQLVKRALVVERLEMMRENAAQMFSTWGQKYRTDRVLESTLNIVQVIKIGHFKDYFPFEIVSRLDELKAFKLLRFKQAVHLKHIPSDATRIEGTAFFSKNELKEFLKRFELSKHLDHRYLGVQMDLFGKDAALEKSSWYWKPRGTFVAETLRRWWEKEMLDRGCKHVSSPKFAKASFFNHFGAVSVAVMGSNNVLTPALEPWHAWMHQNEIQSGETQRFCEISDLYRNEKSHLLRGMFKRDTFVSDLMTAFVSRKDCFNEVISSLQFLMKTVKILGIEIKWVLYKETPKKIRSQDEWSRNAAILTQALTESGIKFEERLGDSWFGPRIAGLYVDCLGCEWKGPFVGIDCVHPNETHLSMVACSMFGSFERIVAALVEQKEGELPFWLTPEQVRVVPVGESDKEYALGVFNELKQGKCRASIDLTDEPLKVKIFTAHRLKIPFTVVIGEKERKKECVVVRDKIEARAMEFEKLIELIRNRELKERFEN